MASVNELVEYADSHLRVSEIHDYPNALNGLQIENSGRVTKIGAAVDASTRTLQAAAEREINFLIVHHGLFWPGLRPITGAFYRQIQSAFTNDIALYSTHLPLDLHPVVGNNAQLAASLGLENCEPSFEMKGQSIGVKAIVSCSRQDLVRKLEHVLAVPVKTFFFGPDQARNVAIISGGAGSEIYGVARQGIDTFITGEAPHWAAVAAEELAINLILGGHYATETFGVKALAAHLSERFGLPWDFIDCPSGL